MIVERAPSEELDRNSRRPLYAQIVRILEREIRERGLPPGTPLPSEAALCERFGVARSVVRQALSLLIAEGFIHREPGRAPTVAARTEHRRMVQRSVGLYEQFAASGILLRSRILKLERSIAPPEVAAFLGSSDAWVLERVRSIDESPLAFVRTWLPRERIPELSAEALQDASLHRVLEARYGLRPGRGRHSIRAVSADRQLAEVLETTQGSPLLMLEGRGMDIEGRPLEWFTTWHRAEQLVFDVEVDAASEQVQPMLPAHREAPDTVFAGDSVGDTSRDSPAHDASDDTSPGDALAELEGTLSAALAQLRRLRYRDTV